MVREVDLALQFEHAVFKHANASYGRGLVAFELVEALQVGFREALEGLQQLRLGIAE
jgi:hypothetical protein